MSDKHLSLSDGSVIKWLPKSHDEFINETIILYGRRKSGKSTIIDEIMYLCRNHISIPIVICNSNTGGTSAYDGKVPSTCIFKDVTREWFENFFIFQQNRADLYNKANNLENLENVFKKINDFGFTDLEKSIKTHAHQYIMQIENNIKLDYAQKKEQKDAIEKIMKSKLTDLYKNAIRKHKHKLENMKNELTLLNKCCIQYVNFIPHIMLIVDDCAASIKKWVKESTTLKDIFYNGRHYYITIIITAQDDKEIDSELRKNTMISFFTTQQAADANFTRSSNHYSKYIKKRAEMCIERIFKNDPNNKVKNFKKLVFKQTENGDPFYYTISDLYPEVKIGCQSLWEFNDKAHNLNNNNDTENNVFLERYGLI